MMVLKPRATWEEPTQTRTEPPRGAYLGDRKRKAKRNQSYSLVPKSLGTEQSKTGGRQKNMEKGRLSAFKGRSKSPSRERWGRGPTTTTDK